MRPRERARSIAHARTAGFTRASKTAAALIVLLATANGDAAPAAGPVRHAHIAERLAPRSIEYPDAPTKLASAAPAWAASLPAIEVKNRNTGVRDRLRLYGTDGELDRSALHRFMQIAASAPDLPDLPSGDAAEPLDARLVQLVFRAAHHFRGAPIVIVSGMRRGAHGKHGTGDALDFQLEGVRAATLAAYVRTCPRAGIGIYTHPKTQYVHMDVRDRSYHWIDGSPPGVTWREKLLPDRNQAKRDASWTSAMDLPESATK